jgi:pyridoxal phosphate enzyme (YggS family)
MAYDAGQRHFAENRVQALLERAEQLPLDIHWHLIGHLQTNKAKYIAPFVHLVHSVDSLRLLETLQKEAEKCNRMVSFLAQIHVAQENSKFGLTPDAFPDFLQAYREGSFPNLALKGLMAMASLTENESQIRGEFARVRLLFEQTQLQIGPSFDTLSMGMSSDYAIALEEGSTVVRIGSSVFA